MLLNLIWSLQKKYCVYWIWINCEKKYLTFFLNYDCYWFYLFHWWWGPRLHESTIWTSFETRIYLLCFIALPSRYRCLIGQWLSEIIVIIAGIYLQQMMFKSCYCYFTESGNIRHLTEVSRRQLAPSAVLSELRRWSSEGKRSKYQGTMTQRSE